MSECACGHEHGANRDDCERCRLIAALFSTLKYLETRADGESNVLWSEVAAVLSSATGRNVD